MTISKNQIESYAESFTPAERDHAVSELGDWFKLDTWSVRQGLLLLAGIDPYRSEAVVLNDDGIQTVGSPVWARITARPGLAVVSDGMPTVTGYFLDPFQFELLSQMLNIWLSKADHIVRDRHAPGYFLTWAKKKNLSPFWEPWAVDAGLVPQVTAEQRQAERYQACIDAGLKFPTHTLGRMPDGIKMVAKSLGITRQSLESDLRKHMDRLNTKSS